MRGEGLHIEGKRDLGRQLEREWMCVSVHTTPHAGVMVAGHVHRTQLRCLVPAPTLQEPWFEGEVAFTPPATAQDGMLEVMEISAKDGSVVVMASVPVRLAAQAGSSSTSAIQLAAPIADGDLAAAYRGVQPDEQLRARLQDVNGSVLEQPIEVVVGNDGVGYADWDYEVKLLDLTITDGVATADFSKEM